VVPGQASELFIPKVPSGLDGLFVHDRTQSHKAAGLERGGEKTAQQPTHCSGHSLFPRDRTVGKKSCSHAPAKCLCACSLPASQACPARPLCPLGRALSWGQRLWLLSSLSGLLFFAPVSFLSSQTMFKMTPDTLNQDRMLYPRPTAWPLLSNFPPAAYSCPTLVYHSQSCTAMASALAGHSLLPASRRSCAN
jgi:hypothetical protein